MLELREVRKSYTTGDFTQVALNDVSIAFRDNEFVAVLGASGSGKTTMLNLIGGLDQYDSGDLVIDGVSTEQYRDRDWDTYRNNRVGFVFQSYNLIPHQTVLANVELALTLSGVSRGERRRRATAALTDVGLAEHAHKRPSQLSGGQMQRVAIARALINDPEILLADEPTGALDSTTSVQIMALLTSIAQDRLVVMVTHNPELADEYATRIVHLSDGDIVEDTDPFVPVATETTQHSWARRTSMGFLTAIALSFNNLMTKKGRTLMTSFAGSIGIIGIASILALANGVNSYIKGVEEDTLSQYPLTIQAQGLDVASMLLSRGTQPQAAQEGAGVEVREVPMMAKMFSNVGTNDLGSLKTFLDNDGGGVDDLVNAIEYTYDVTPQIFADGTGNQVRQVNPDTALVSLGFQPSAAAAGVTAGLSTSAFSEMVANRELVEEQYEVVAGNWPEAHDELVVVVSQDGGLSDLALYAMGLLDPAELDEMVRQMMAEQDVEAPENQRNFTYDDLMGSTFSVVNAAEYYVLDEDFGVWTDRSEDQSHLNQLASEGTPIRVVGVVRSLEEDTVTMRPGIYYTPQLTQHLMTAATAAPIVQEQLAEPSVNVLTGRGFADDEPAAELDLTTLFSIDESAVTDAFVVDQSMLQPDLSGLDLDIDPSSIDIDPSKLPPLDLSAVLENLDPASLVSPPELTGVELPQLPEVDPELVETQIPVFMAAYTAYAVTNGLDPAELATNVPIFVSSEEGGALLTGLAEELQIDREDIELQLGAYMAWAAQRELDPSDVTANLEAFVAEQQQAALDAALASVNTTELERQLQAELGSYLEQVMQIYLADVASQLTTTISTQLGTAVESAMGDMAANFEDAISIDEDAFMAAFQLTKSQEELTQLLVSSASTRAATYESTMRTLGYASPDEPSDINIYPLDFESKAQITALLDDYNERMRDTGREEQVISYTDIVGALMSSVTDIINTISYVLIAFVAISLVVSSIMIGVITYISVLERRKEIGILRAVGASKRDIRRVFNAETLIVGLVAGVIGVFLTVVLTIPTNLIVEARFYVPNVAVLPWQAGVILVLISMALTALAGLLPSSSASRKDPVEALRSE